MVAFNSNSWINRLIIRVRVAKVTLTLHRQLQRFRFRLLLCLSATAKNEPLETMAVSKSRAWEVQFDSFLTNVLQPAGFDLIRWTRVPYLCEGDFSRSFYSLNDVVMIVKPSDEPSEPYILS